MHITDVLQQRNIPFITEGKNVKKGNIAIHCPWCGDADQSMHMGIDLTTGKFGCWRNVMHRGPKIHSLLMKLLGCSWDAVQALLTDTSDLQTIVKRLQPEAVQVEQPTNELTIPGLRKPSYTALFCNFYAYMLQRGYTPEQTDIAVDLYGIRYGLFGKFNNRVVFPIQNKSVVGYVGRCIDNGNLRYLSEPGKAVKQNILWIDLLKQGGGRLLITEGPFDALRMDFVARMEGLPDRATCLFGTSYTQPQVDILQKLSKHYKELVILFDRDALSQAMQLRRALLGKAKIQMLPESRKDPAELKWCETFGLLRSLDIVK